MAHPRITSNSGRQFDAHSAGLIPLIIDREERFLMLSSPARPGKWEPVNGAYDGGETILAGLMREIHEEAGEAVKVRPLTAVHTYSFRYDETIPHMISIVFLFEYLGGEVAAGDDMAGSEVRWMSVADITSGRFEVIIPQGQFWIYERAVTFYRALRDGPDVDLQPGYDGLTNKYGE